MRQPPEAPASPCTPSAPRFPPAPGSPGLAELLGQGGPVLVPAPPEPALDLWQREAALDREDGHLVLGRGEWGRSQRWLPSCPCPRTDETRPRYPFPCSPRPCLWDCLPVDTEAAPRNRPYTSQPRSQERQVADRDRD